MVPKYNKLSVKHALFIKMSKYKRPKFI